MQTSTPRRAAIYARVSTLDQEPENQLAELRRYISARGWTAVEFVDRGISGARDRRPALDAILTAIKRRQFDVLVCWRLDRLGRSLKHLVTLLDELQVLGVAFVSLAEGIDALVMDVKCGRAAFMKTREQAETLMQSLVSTGRAAGVEVVALLTDMDTSGIQEVLWLFANSRTDPEIPNVISSECAQTQNSYTRRNSGSLVAIKRDVPEVR